ncbi:hypothetical protein C9374_003802 [Naegleria lovaniensis]|uniref:Uncharacterized protein n=1 Tax=Naegleria lovaniensis TaxID=51637 RepID=A0AA88GZS9_NAELO|nr:uncharacterized protein C9374_003802 [Naegleria lovaniensis]KAG2394038.1 hypothetical protein C9374_003802 [Naegleria lovaniensis]
MFTGEPSLFHPPIHQIISILQTPSPVYIILTTNGTVLVSDSMARSNSLLSLLREFHDHCEEENENSFIVLEETHVIRGVDTTVMKSHFFSEFESVFFKYSFFELSRLLAYLAEMRVNKTNHAKTEIVTIYCRKDSYRLAMKALESINFSGKEKEQTQSYFQILETITTPFGDCYILPKWMFGNENVKCIATNDGSKMAIVTESNSVYVYGMEGFSGKKVFVTDTISFTNRPFAIQIRPPKSAFQHVEFNEGKFFTCNQFQIENVKCGNNFIACLCRNHEIVIAGDNSIRTIGLPSPSFYGILTPLRFNQLIEDEKNRNDNVIDMASGFSFICYLTSSGHAFYSGTLVKRCPERIEPILISNYENQKIVKIAAYGKSATFLLDDHRTLCHMISGLTFKEIVLEFPEEIVDLCCGDDILQVLTRCESDQPRLLNVYTVVFSERALQSIHSLTDIVMSQKPEQHGVEVKYHNCNSTSIYGLGLSPPSSLHDENVNGDDAVCSLYSNFSDSHKSLRLCLYSQVYRQFDSLINGIDTKDIQYMKQNLVSLIKNAPNFGFQSDICVQMA